MVSPSTISFKKKPSQLAVTESGCWKVLSVEDDPAYQASLRLALKNLTVQGLAIEFVAAGSAAEAAKVIAEHSDIAVILLDVVMEQDDAGLRLVSTIRETLGNATVRIVLLTGQPGMAPEKDVMKRYDIDDYWCKTDLSNQHLLTLLTSNIRTYDHLSQLQSARQGLQVLIDASQSLSKKRDFNSFACAVLEEVANILGEKQGGILCSLNSLDEEIAEASIVCAIGEFSVYDGKQVKDIWSKDLIETFSRAARLKEHVFIDGYSLLYFSSADVDGRYYLTLVRIDRPLTNAEMYLLQVFSEHVSTGFANLALYNRLAELAYCDALLGIHNRNWLLRELDHLDKEILSESQLFVVDVQDFIAIGISLGEEFCDQLLQALHQHLCYAFAPYGFKFARIDRDSFALLGSTEHQFDSAFFEKLFAQPLKIADGEHRIAVTAAKVPLQQMVGMQAEQMVRLAESTVDTARHRGLGFLAYDEVLQREIAASYRLVSELRTALSKDELFVELQPKVRLHDGALVGFEALARWRNSQGDLVPPDRFIPLAEAAGLINKLDQTILRKTCRAVKLLQAHGIDVPVAFNVSSIEMLQVSFFDELFALIAEEGVEPRQLDLEITETQAMTEYKSIAPSLRKIIAMGMGVSIDDFGTGYSSLSHITDLAVTTLKIDRSFVSRLGHSDDSLYVAKTIVQLARRFGFSVVAEGIESESQRDILLANGCAIGQGYWYSKPVSVEDAIKWSQGKII